MTAARPRKTSRWSAPPKPRQKRARSPLSRAKPKRRRRAVRTYIAQVESLGLSVDSTALLLRDRATARELELPLVPLGARADRVVSRLPFEIGDALWLTLTRVKRRR